MRRTGKYYDTDPDDPDAPVELEEYNGIKRGEQVYYHNDALTSSLWLGLGGPLIVSAIYRFPGALGGVADYITAILNDGEYECNANNLRKEKE